MNVALWVAQVILALVFFGAGFDQAANYPDAARRMAWVRAMPSWLARLVGVFEMVTAVALVMPGLISVAMWLTPAAAVALIALMLFAVTYHVTRREIPQIAFSTVFGIVAAFVALGRIFVTPL